jgi:hypothetical protein
MPLIDLKTNLKSLKYGKDRIGGGDSNQPYITNDINNPTNVLGFDDGFVRGGAVGAVRSSIIDTLRIGKFLTDVPKGPLFIAKQVGLQFSNPKLEVKKSVGGFFAGLLTGDIGPATGGALQPTRLYNLGINTLAQVPVNAFGIHFNRHGLLPVQDNNTKYLAVVTANNKGNSKNNRLVNYLDTKLNVTTVARTKTSLFQKFINLIPIVKGFVQPKQQTLNSYLGGPGSVYGIGTTIIKRYDYTTVHEKQNNQTPQEKGKVNYPGLLGVSNKYFQPSAATIQGAAQNAIQNSSFSSLGVLGSIFASSIKSQSSAINRYNHIDLSNPTTPPPQINQTAVVYRNNTPAGRTYEELNAQINKNTQKPQPNSTIGGNPGNVQYFGDLGVSRAYFYDPLDIEEGDTALDVNGITNNGKTITPPSVITYTSNNAVGRYFQLQQQIATESILKNVNSVGIYNTNRSGSTVNNTNSGYNLTQLIDPNGSGSIQYKNSYNERVRIKGYKSWDEVSRENRVGSSRKDAINLTPIFSKSGSPATDRVKIGKNSYLIRDLVKFRIEAIDGSTPSKSDFMIFRAYLTQFSDSVDATWNSVKYAGRGEDFYIYGGFGRKISINFKVAALSVDEMQPMYNKLNYLMGNLMPDYSGILMRGPLVKMTVGNWLDGQPGILNSLSYNVPQDSPWEISLGEDIVGVTPRAGTAGILVGGVDTLILPHVVEVNMTFTPIGSQTKGVNKISKKDEEISHLAQNINANEIQYITGSIQAGT